MLWLIMGVICWVVLIATKDKRRITRSLWAGLITVICQLVVDYFAVKIQLYTLHYELIGKFFGEIPILYTLGIVFPMGVAFAYHFPYRKILKFLHILVFAVLFWRAEKILESKFYLVYIHWNEVLSITVNILVFMAVGFLVENLDLRGGD